jgi:hypothetical protein
MTNKSFRDYINLIEAAQQENLSEDGVESWAGNPSDRRHPGHESYMTPEYMLAHYKKRLAQIAAGKHKYPKEVAQLQAKIAKLEKQGVAEDWDPDTTRLEQDVRDALENGDDYTAKQYAKMAPTPEAKKYLLNIIKQAMYIDDLGGETDWKGVAEEQLEETSPDAVAKVEQLFRHK